MSKLEVWMPPSTGRIWPVTYDDASEARYTAAAAMSSASPIRLMGVPASLTDLRSSFSTLSSASVTMAPGAMAFTRILGARSAAMVRVSWIIAALAVP